MSQVSRPSDAQWVCLSTMEIVSYSNRLTAALVRKELKNFVSKFKKRRSYIAKHDEVWKFEDKILTSAPGPYIQLVPGLNTNGMVAFSSIVAPCQGCSPRVARIILVTRSMAHEISKQISLALRSRNW
jgi:hypothetical protein